MTSQQPPFRRNLSPIVAVQGRTFEGPCVIEVRREEWRASQTGRYRAIWCARQRGRLSWDAARDLRTALRHAAYVPQGRRPAWLTQAVADVKDRLG